MFTWPEIVLLGLKLLNAIMTEVGDAKSFKAGTDAEIAAVTAAIMRKTQAGKAIMEKVDAMSPEEVDVGLRDLEPR